VFEAVRDIVMQDPRVSYALLFGSVARGTARSASDVDVAIGVTEPLDVHELGSLVSRLESATGREVDLILLDEAPMALAYRVFRDGVVLFERDHQAFAARKARAILEYLDFKPLEDICVRGVLAAAQRHGR
jgi:predicted nucleotidyltransferase